ncbi:MAG: hypothetical protein WAU69_00625, partial [Solirubrobacteraceae bacterium]
ACGAPVAAFDLPALREVLDGRAALVEPGDLVGLVQAAQQLTRPAPKPPRWSWQDAGRATWQVYDRAIARGDAAFMPAGPRASRRSQMAESR